MAEFRHASLQYKNDLAEISDTQDEIIYTLGSLYTSSAAISTDMSKPSGWPLHQRNHTKDVDFSPTSIRLR
jgi:hypothetical protein